MITAELSIFGQRQLRPGSIVRKKSPPVQHPTWKRGISMWFPSTGDPGWRKDAGISEGWFQVFFASQRFFHCLGQVSSYFLCRPLVQAGNRDSFLACQRGEQHKAQHGKMKKAESRMQEDQDPNDTNQTCWWIFWFSIASASSRRVALLQID